MRGCGNRPAHVLAVIRPAAAQGLEQAGQYVQQGKETAGQYVDRGKEYYDKGRTQWTEYVDKGKGLVQDQASKVAAAVDAGKEAYTKTAGDQTQA